MFVGDGSSNIAYTPPTFPTTATFSAWFRIPTNSNMNGLFCLRNSFTVFGSRDSANVYAYDGAGKQFTGVNFPDDTPFHLAMVVDGSTHKYYIDGVEAGSVACGNLVANGSNFLRAMRNHSGNFGVARIGEFGFWTTALSAGDVADLYGLEEPTHTSGSITLATDLTFSDDLTWDSYGNGTVVETTTREHYIVDQWETDPESFGSPVDGRSYRVRISAANDGGNDPAEDQVSNTVVYESGEPGGSTIPVIQHHYNQLRRNR
ncbi:LamG-like jellyroll fold domain-containing protein [Botrimarina mediterranea]|uniref:LamG-like jellyroll fold domain-containing protein n=1 Tax=Botrimarina mediterranea TaxID=2528022 RepID=UPI003AF31CEA